MKRNRIWIGGMIAFILYCMPACIKTDSQYKNNQYFQYYVSTIRIKEPRVVFFHNSGVPYDNPMSAFVCPDSAVIHCTDSGWINRGDVFLYNCQFYEDEQNLCKAYGCLLYKLKSWDVGGCTYKEESLNDSISIARFYFDSDLPFVLSLHTTSFYYDNTKRPKNEPMSEKWDLLDTAIFSNTYRLAVRPKYTIWQALQIRRLYKESKHYICYEIVESADTIVYIPYDCTKEEQDNIIESDEEKQTEEKQDKPNPISSFTDTMRTIFGGGNKDESTKENNFMLDFRL